MDADDFKRLRDWEDLTARIYEDKDFSSGANMSDRWIWVSLPRATFAIVTRDGVVVDAAPYGWKLINRLGTTDERLVAAYFRTLKAEFAEVPASTG